MRHAVILAGGVGERFWPLSRRDRPKQFLSLAGDRSLLRDTYRRLRPLVRPECVWVVTASDQAAQVRRELPEVPRGNILAEPEGKNTAAAVYWAALAAGRKDPQAVLVTVPSDAWIPDPKVYQATLRKAFKAARENDFPFLVGVRPTRVETGYGYILPGPKSRLRDWLPVRRFEEKPDLAKARRMFRAGKHLWNCGIFAWGAAVLDRAVEQHLPGLFEAFLPLKTGAWSPKTIRGAYRRAPAVSVDYGILEKAANLGVLPADFVWDDLGSWRALDRLGVNGSFTRGESVCLDAPGSIVWSEGGVVALVGLKDVVVVHTPDATLVAAKDRAQDVRSVVQELAKTPKGRKFLRRQRRKR